MLLAWNYNEKMYDFKEAPVQQLDLITFHAYIQSFLMRYPKLSLILYSKVGTAPKIQEILKAPLQEDIKQRPHLY